jgi:hypothetical protein
VEDGLVKSLPPAQLIEGDKYMKKIIEAIKEYQVPGAVGDFDENNFKQDGVGVEWSDHVPGTLILPTVGSIFLGMPFGFNRLGARHERFEDNLKINIFTDFEQFKKRFNGYNKFNIPCWKYINNKGHVMVRGLSPRINRPFLHIILEDCLDKIDCLEITEKDIVEMD